MKLSLMSVEKEYVRLAAEGDIGTADPAVEGPGSFASILGDDWATKKTLLDFTNVRSLGSATIGWLISSNKAFRAAGGRLVLHSMRPNVADVFKLIRIGDRFPIVKGEAEAIAAAAKATGGA